MLGGATTLVIAALSGCESTRRHRCDVLTACFSYELLFWLFVALVAYRVFIDYVIYPNLIRQAGVFASRKAQKKTRRKETT